MNVTELGLIGHPLGHSLSPFLHEEIMTAAGINGRYRPFDIKPLELAGRFRQLQAELAGFNCTIPHKEAVIPYLDSLDETASLTRSVNTIRQGRGYNTDYAAFCTTCPLPPGGKVLILGAGGVSRTMAFAAASRDCQVWINARRSEQADQLARAIKQKLPQAKIQSVSSLAKWQQAAGDSKDWILLNGTPVGLWPLTRQSPLPSHLLRHFTFVYDTIYNPLATRLILAAREQGLASRSGLAMLFQQALAAQKIWHPGVDFPKAGMALVQARLARAVLDQFPFKIILAGFMGSGKTTVGQILARQLQLPFLDLDAEIERSAGSSIAAIFAGKGESFFRKLERQQLARCLQEQKSLVLATGGGALLSEGTEELLQGTACAVIYLDVGLDEIKKRLGNDKARPLLARGGARTAELYKVRQPLYRQLADLTIDGAAEAALVAGKIQSLLGLEGSL